MYRMKVGCLWQRNLWQNLRADPPGHVTDNNIRRLQNDRESQLRLGMVLVPSVVSMPFGYGVCNLAGRQAARGESAPCAACLCSAFLFFCTSSSSLALPTKVEVESGRKSCCCECCVFAHMCHFLSFSFCHNTGRDWLCVTRPVQAHFSGFLGTDSPFSSVSTARSTVGSSSLVN